MIPMENQYSTNLEPLPSNKLPALLSMDAYRAVYGPPAGCITWPYLREILQVAQPRINLEKASVDRLQEREQLLFFPQGAVREIFRSKNEGEPVKEILGCRCDRCRRCKSPKNSELEEVASRILKESTILLAILIYVGHGYLIRQFGSNDRIKDASPDAVTTVLKARDNIERSQRILRVDDEAGVETFCQLYHSARNLFLPPTFCLGGPTTRLGDTYRMPFLEDLPHAHGQSGKVRKFNIHEDYLDQQIKDEDWYNSRTQVSDDFLMNLKVLFVWLDPANVTNASTV